MMCRIRYLGGGLGRIPRSLRTRLDMPLGLVSPFISVSRACEGAHPSAAHPAHDDPVRQRRGSFGRMRGPRVGTRRAASAAPGSTGSGCRCSPGWRRTAQRSRCGAESASGGAHGATRAEAVRLVEEHDHPAVPQRQLAQLAVERLHLDDADAHEHVDERPDRRTRTDARSRRRSTRR